MDGYTSMGPNVQINKSRVDLDLATNASVESSDRIFFRSISMDGYTSMGPNVQINKSRGGDLGLATSVSQRRKSISLPTGVSQHAKTSLLNKLTHYLETRVWNNSDGHISVSIVLGRIRVAHGEVAGH
jgi:hypothetical protein